MFIWICSGLMSKCHETYILSTLSKFRDIHDIGIQHAVELLARFQSLKNMIMMEIRFSKWQIFNMATTEINIVVSAMQRSTTESTIISARLNMTTS